MDNHAGIRQLLKRGVHRFDCVIKHVGVERHNLDGVNKLLNAAFIALIA
jgi:hypothetical protein